MWRNPVGTARGKAPALPLMQELTPEQQSAQDLALSHPAVLTLTAGRRSEVINIERVLAEQYTPLSTACASSDCFQVEVYNFDEDAAVVAIVDVNARNVLDVLYQPGVHPGLNQRLSKLALEIASSSPTVIDALGYRPERADMAPVEANMLSTSCDGRHLCAGVTYMLGDRLFWAIVDLTDETLAGTAWTSIEPVVDPAEPLAFTGCPVPGSVVREPWALDHAVTGDDGLRVYNVTYRGVPVLQSVKLVEWHVRYSGTFGFVDLTGCGSGSGGFVVQPFGQTQILDLYDQSGQELVGFEVVQDFRMDNWGNSCNYRYDQRIQFYNSGRFRVVSGAYGKGCGTDAEYRPVVRIDLAVAGDDSDTFDRWNGVDWQTISTEDYLVPYSEPEHGPHVATPEGFAWRVLDEGGLGYYVEQDVGQFDGAQGRGADPFLYVTQHHSDEGDTDLGSIGSCCNDNHLQGPEAYLTGEATERTNLVLWYVPQGPTDGDPGTYYCWTLSGEPNPETYPCFMGPTFVPVYSNFSFSTGADVGDDVAFTDRSIGGDPKSYSWDFGDGVGTSTEQNPMYQFNSAGVFSVTLTVSNTLGSDTRALPIAIGTPPQASFDHNGPIALSETAVFTNTSTGSAPMNALWDFGDGTISTVMSPSHSYAQAGMYTVTLQVSNPLGTDQALDAIAVNVPPIANFSYQEPLLAGWPSQFYDESLGATDLSWDFGDGVGSSTEANPSYIYPSPGRYTVTLTASNPFGEAVSSQEILIGAPLFFPFTQK